MEPRRVRLGDVVDDYCSRCRLIMNHGVVGMVGDEVKKVRCNTCLWEHQFRHGQLPASRKKARSKLFEERSEEHTSELQSPYDLVCRLLLEKKKLTIGELVPDK